MRTYTFINNSSEEEDMWKDELLEHQIGGWGAAYAAGSRGSGSPERSVFLTGTGMSITLLKLHVFVATELLRVGEC